MANKAFSNYLEETVFLAVDSHLRRPKGLKFLVAQWLACSETCCNRFPFPHFSMPHWLQHQHLKTGINWGHFLNCSLLEFRTSRRRDADVRSSWPLGLHGTKSWDDKSRNPICMHGNFVFLFASNIISRKQCVYFLLQCLAQNSTKIIQCVGLVNHCFRAVWAEARMRSISGRPSYDMPKTFGQRLGDGEWMGMRSRPFRILGHLRLVGVRPKGNVEITMPLQVAWTGKLRHDSLVGSNNYHLRMCR